MKTKTAYRLPKNIPAEEPSNIPPERDEPPQPSETARVEFTNGADKAEPSVAIVSADEYPQPDEATVALMRQLDHLRASEQAQKDFAAQVAAQRAAQAAPAPTLPAEPEARIALWRTHGLTDEDAAFLSEHPDMIDNPHLTRVAYAATTNAGIARDSPDFPAAMEGNFATLLNRAQAQAQAPTSAATPAFFEPPEAPRPPAAPDRSAIMSAPVSRREAGGYREPSLRQIKLTSEEAAIAAASGVSETEYARQKLRMLKAKASGELQ